MPTTLTQSFPHRNYTNPRARRITRRKRDRSADFARWLREYAPGLPITVFQALLAYYAGQQFKDNLGRFTPAATATLIVVLSIQKFLLEGRANGQVYKQIFNAPLDVLTGPFHFFNAAYKKGSARPALLIIAMFATLRVVGEACIFYVSNATTLQKMTDDKIPPFPEILALLAFVAQGLATAKMEIPLSASIWIKVADYIYSLMGRTPRQTIPDEEDMFQKNIAALLEYLGQLPQFESSAIETTPNPDNFEGLSDFVSTDEFKKVLWGNPGFVNDTLTPFARRQDASQMLNIFKMHGTLSNEPANTTPEILLLRTFLLPSVWNVILGASTRIVCQEDISRIKERLRLPDNCPVNLQTSMTFEWSNKTDAKTARKEIMLALTEYINNKSARRIISEMYRSENPFFPRSRPTKLAYVLGFILTFLFISPAWFFISQANYQVVESLGYSIMRASGDDPDNPTETQAAIIAQVATAWSTLQVIVTCWAFPGMFFWSANTLMTKLLALPKQTSFGILTAIRQHPIVAFLSAVILFANVALWSSLAKQVIPNDALFASLLVSSLFGGLFIFPGLIAPRILALSDGVPSDEQQILATMIDLSPGSDLERRTVGTLQPVFAQYALAGLINADSQSEPLHVSAEIQAALLTRRP